MLTVSSLPIGKKSFYDELVAHAQLDKLRFISHMHKKAKGVFSLLLLKNLSFDDDMAHGKKTGRERCKAAKKHCKEYGGVVVCPAQKSVNVKRSGKRVCKRVRH
jgi:hypothetical protein